MKVFCQHCTGVGGGGGKNVYRMFFFCPTLVTKVVAVFMSGQYLMSAVIAVPQTK